MKNVYVVVYVRYKYAYYQIFITVKRGNIRYSLFFYELMSLNTRGMRYLCIFLRFKKYIYILLACFCIGVYFCMQKNKSIIFLQ